MYAPMLHLIQTSIRNASKFSFLARKQNINAQTPQHPRTAPTTTTKRPVTHLYRKTKAIPSTPKTNLQLIAACDNFPYDQNMAKSYYSFHLPKDSRVHGYMLPGIVAVMPWTSAFEVSHATRTVRLRDSAEIDNVKHCNLVLQELVNKIIALDLFKVVHGQHSELFKVLGANYPVSIERFATSLFGIVIRGSHLTAYVKTNEGIKIWIARRSMQLKSYPGKLDTTVGGGVRDDESPFETIIHEGNEEASLPEGLLRQDVRAAGVLTYMRTVAEGDIGELGLVVPETVFVHDIELSTDVTPKPQDEEVQDFALMSVPEVQAALANGEFKTKCAAIMIDFLIRHGYITAENEKDFLQINMRMHRQFPFPTSAM